MSFFPSPFVVFQKSEGQYVDGFWQEGFDLVRVIQASVQPVSGLEMKSFPGARRDSQAIKIYSRTELFTLKNKTNPEIITAFGAEFEISEVLPYQSNLINHYKAIAYKVAESRIPKNVRITTDGQIRITADGFVRIYNTNENPFGRIIVGEIYRITPEGELRIYNE